MEYYKLFKYDNEVVIVMLQEGSGTQSPLALLAATCSRLGAANMGPEQQQENKEQQQHFSQYFILAVQPYYTDLFRPARRFQAKR